MSTYSYSLDARHLEGFREAFFKACRKRRLYDEQVINLDFHSVPHYGDESVLETHWAGAKDKALKSALTLFIQDALGVTADTLLTFTVNEETSWMGYSLDGNENVTVTGNTTLNDLSIGSHDVIVFASDTSENMGSSDTIYFEVSEGGTPPGGIGGGGTPMFEITYV